MDIHLKAKQRPAHSGLRVRASVVSLSVWFRPALRIGGGAEGAGVFGSWPVLRRFLLVLGSARPPGDGLLTAAAPKRGDPTGRPTPTYGRTAFHLTHLGQDDSS